MVRHAEISLLEERLCLITDTKFLRTRSHHSELFGAGWRQEDRREDGEEEHIQLEMETEEGWDQQDELHHEHFIDSSLDHLCWSLNYSQPVFGKSCRAEVFGAEDEENAEEKDNRQEKKGHTQENPKPSIGTSHANFFELRWKCFWGAGDIVKRKYWKWNKKQQIYKQKYSNDCRVDLKKE